jgi:DnaJ-class molecular chaperone
MNDYQTLGVKPGASDEEIKKAYRKAAMQNHPDKGGDPEKFKEINDAYNNITNKKSTEPFPFGGFPFGGFPFGFRNGPGPGVIFRQSVDVGFSLEDLYKGKRIRVNNVEVNIPPRTPLSAQIEVPNTNIVVRISLIRHPVFQIESGTMNLVFKQTISLCEALTGFKGRLKHPDGRMMFFETSVNKVLKNNEHIYVRRRGIPVDQHKNSDLVLVFDINMPQSIDEKYKGIVKEMLRFDVPEIMPNSNEETITL